MRIAVVLIILIFQFFSPAAFAARGTKRTAPKAVPKKEVGSNCPIPLFEPLKAVQRLSQTVLGGAAFCEGELQADEIKQFDCNSKVMYRGRPLETANNLMGIATGMFFQDVAGNSHAQAVCRLNFFAKYSTDEPARTKLNSAAEASFNKHKGEIKDLLDYERELRKGLADTRDRIRGDRAMSSMMAEGIADYEKKIQETKETIQKKLLAIPMGFEPEVGRALIAMAEKGSFDTNVFQGGMGKAVFKYQETDKYYRDKFIPTAGNEGYYCIGLDYRNQAARTGQIDSWIKTYNSGDKTDRSFRDKMGCRLNATYGDGRTRLNTGLAVAGFAAMLVPGVLEARMAAGAVSLSADAIAATTVVVRGAAAVDTVMSIDSLRQECMPPSAFISGDRRTCDAQKEFDHVVEESKTSSCALGAISAASVPLHIFKALKAARELRLSRVAQTSDELTEEVAEEIVVTARRKPSAARAKGPKPTKIVDHPGDFTTMSSGPGVSAENVLTAFRTKYPTAKATRIPIDLPIAPRTEAQGAFVSLSPEDTASVNRWAEEVLATAQAANPTTKLRIKGVHVGMDWNAAGSSIHADNAGTYLHASSTLPGGKSTIMFTETGTKQVRALEKELREKLGSAVFPSIQKIDAQGNMTVLFKQGSNEVHTATLGKDAYMRPKPGTTAIFSGTDHSKVTPGRSPAYHASPLRGRGSKDRVTLFIGIEPE